MPYSRKSYFIVRLAGDLFFLVLSFIISVFVAKNYMDLRPVFLVLNIEEWLLFVMLCLVWLTASRAIGQYDEFRIRSFSFELLSLAKMIAFLTGVSIFFLFSFKKSELSRFFIGINAVLELGLIGGWKLFLRIYLGRLHRMGKYLRYILVVGTGRVARDFQRAIAILPHLGYRIIGFIDDHEAGDLGELYRGNIDQLEAILASGTVDDVVVASPRHLADRVENVIRTCEKYPVSLRLIPDYFDYIGSRYSISIFSQFPMLSLRAIPLDNPVSRVIKRSFDLVFSLILFITVFSWLWPLVAIAIKLSSRGPIFFKQERWGLKNRNIQCYKFRTMVRDSRDVDENGRYLQALPDDPRITRVGRFLRKTSIDEFPQFINVLKGEMSIVGPRPHPTPLNLESRGRIENYMLRHLVKPGITGWAQIHGFRGETKLPEKMEKRVEHDMWYIENWSFWLDLRVIGLTIWHLLRGDPKAY